MTVVKKTSWGWLLDVSLVALCVILLCVILLILATFFPLCRIENGTSSQVYVLIFGEQHFESPVFEGKLEPGQTKTLLLKPGSYLVQYNEGAFFISEISVSEKFYHPRLAGSHISITIP